jgi:hypothetical protein
MSFKRNLLKKIQIDKLTYNVLLSLKPQDYGAKVDKDSMKRLLEMGNYQHESRRDLDLYIKTDASGANRILVLDNELAFYNSDVDDVALRKSPTIKEMLNIRNAIKILNDSDVVISKKTVSVESVQKECIEVLDLSLEIEDLETITKDGIVALEIEDMDGVIESLSLFAELLEYCTPPKHYRIGSLEIIGQWNTAENGNISPGPLVIYSPSNNTLKYISGPISGSDKQNVEYLQNVAVGKEKPSGEGVEVFQYLKESALKKFF